VSSGFMSDDEHVVGRDRAGQMMPSASWLISTHAAMVRLTPMP
jgi:hypothetical protein